VRVDEPDHDLVQIIHDHEPANLPLRPPLKSPYAVFFHYLD
jgi:hypothetical protein